MTANRPGYLRSLAGAPISWGICEVPGWGLQMTPERILSEMREVGIVATEVGAAGFLGHTADDITRHTKAYGLDVVGAFVPLVMHNAEVKDQMRADARAQAGLLKAVGASYFVTAVVVDPDWAPRYHLSPAEWKRMYAAFGEVDDICDEFGLTQVVHPHVGTLVETKADALHVLEHSPVRWTLDTGHLHIGGTDPEWFVKHHFDRVGYVHLKDVAGSLIEPLNTGTLSLFDAVRGGIFTVLGEGDVPIAATIAALEAGGYDGYYVIEQDVAIVGEEPEVGGGPIDGVRASIAYLERLAAK
jgi:inosose dehydratase